ncbi:MAG: adenylosuccinate synthetase [Nanoarchaeota archaeon]
MLDELVIPEMERLVGDAQVIGVIDFLYGDGGKGKIAAWLALLADLYCRGTGGANAGHTFFLNNRKIIQHLLPVGIAYDNLGKTTVLGSGMAIDPHELCSELEQLVAIGGSHNGLRIDEDAAVVMPWHIAIDRARNKSQVNGGIGSTGRGIGPCYEDKTGRRGINMRDILSPDVLTDKLRKLREIYPEFAQEMTDEKVVETLRPAAEMLRDYITNTATIVHRSIRAGKKVILEGAQGTLLSVQHGVHPYVTSSDCSINGTAAGVGISAGAVDLVLGIVKFPFMTRVGAGPFPTEFGGRDSEEYCAAENNGSPLNGRVQELDRYGIKYDPANPSEYDRKDPKIIELMNSSDPLTQGIGVRLAGDEFGATTGRPRRTGWTDAVAVKYAAEINRPSDPTKMKLVLTKPDSLAGIEEFRVAYNYGRTNAPGTTDFSRDEIEQRSVIPFHSRYPGYGDISGVRKYDELPGSLRESITDLERFIRTKVGVVSVGPKPEQTIVV